MIFGDCPILKFEVGHSLEVANIVCDYGRIEAQRVGGNHRVEDADWAALRFEVRPKMCIICCCITVPLKNH